MAAEKLTPEKARDLWEQADAIMERLRVRFPCEACDGTGEDEPTTAHHYVYGSPPCESCWGRGFVIPEKQEGMR